MGQCGQRAWTEREVTGRQEREEGGGGEREEAESTLKRAVETTGVAQFDLTRSACHQ